eukprot:5399076-Prymnesium_polylepis.1
MALKIRAAKEKKGQAAPAAGPTGGGARKRGACSLCGQLGHNKSNKKKCPGPPPGGPAPKAKPTACAARTPTVHTVGVATG